MPRHWGTTRLFFLSAPRSAFAASRWCSLPAAASRRCSLPAGCFPCRRLLRFPLPTVFHSALANSHRCPQPVTASRCSCSCPAAASCKHHFSSYTCAPACSSATAPRPAICSSAPRLLLPIGALAGNKPHPAEKSTPVWLAIWRTWAGFANSQLRRAALRCI